MSKNKVAILALVLVGIALTMTVGCAANKRNLATIEEQKAQLDQANARIGELEQNNSALDKSLKEAQNALAGAQSEKDRLTQNLGTLRDRIAVLENEKAELDKAVAAGKESEASYMKKTRSLNGQIGTLRKQASEQEALIASKDAEIATLKTNEAALKAAAEEQARKMAALSSEKDALAAEMEKTVAGKNRTILILAVLLAAAVIAAIVGIVRGGKKSAA